MNIDNFEFAFQYTIGNEGGFTKDPNDSGNWTGGSIGSGQLKGTKYGISAASYPNLDIENLTLDQAKTIYRNDFWNKYNYDKINSSIVSTKCFDMTVNMGQNATFIIQLAIKSFVNDIVIDGNIGPVTIQNINSINENSLFDCLETASGVYYWTLANKANKNLRKYLPGWLIRAFKIIKGQ